MWRIGSGKPTNLVESAADESEILLALQWRRENGSDYDPPVVRALTSMTVVQEEFRWYSFTPWREMPRIGSMQLEHLRKERRAIAFDLRGHGQSDPPLDGDYAIAVSRRRYRFSGNAH